MSNFLHLIPFFFFFNIKKHLACNYHRVREAIAGGFITFGHIDTKLNIADMCTKPLSVTTLQTLLDMCLFRKPKTLQAATSS